MGLTIRNIMQTNVRTIGPRQSLADLQQALLSEDVGGLPVVDAGQLVGMVSRSDVVQRLQSERVLAMRRIGLPPEVHLTGEDAIDLGDEIGERLERIRVEDVMNRDIVSARQDDTVRTAAELMSDKHIHRLPILDAYHLVGVVTAHDIVRLVADGTFVAKSSA